MLTKSMCEAGNSLQYEDLEDLLERIGGDITYDNAADNGNNSEDKVVNEEPSSPEP